MEGEEGPKAPPLSCFLQCFLSEMIAVVITVTVINGAGGGSCLHLLLCPWKVCYPILWKSAHIYSSVAILKGQCSSSDEKNSS